MTEAKKERKPTKKFFTFNVAANTVVAGLTASGVVTALMTDESLNVFEQESPTIFDLSPEKIVNDKFKKQTVISYHE